MVYLLVLVGLGGGHAKAKHHDTANGANHNADDQGRKYQ